jgi:hypothetical protein
MLWVELLGNKHGVIFKEGKAAYNTPVICMAFLAYLLSINMLRHGVICTSSGSVRAVLGHLGGLI